jgi:hypothetical protein
MLYLYHWFYVLFASKLICCCFAGQWCTLDNVELLSASSQSCCCQQGVVLLPARCGAASGQARCYAWLLLAHNTSLTARQNHGASDISLGYTPLRWAPRITLVFEIHLMIFESWSSSEKYGQWILEDSSWILYITREIYMFVAAFVLLFMHR